MFVIDTPPPTVSGNLHMGHVFSYCHADFIARYKRLKGCEVFYPMGFDDNGLPTERLVEKITGIRVGYKFSEKSKQFLSENLSKLNINTDSICSKSDFRKICHEIVNDAEKEFEKLFRSIDLSVDWNLKYQTISENSANIAQNAFIDLYKKNLIYLKNAPVYWCTKDETATANTEIEEKLVPSFEVEIDFTVKETGEKLRIMTTRPEMLPACRCLLFNESDERYQHLKGKTAITPLFEIEVPIIPDFDAKSDKGTGVVMCCTYGDWQDVIWSQRYNLDAKIIITNNGDIPFYGPKNQVEITVKDKQSAEKLISKIETECHTKCKLREYDINEQKICKILCNSRSFNHKDMEKFNIFYEKYIHNLDKDLYCITELTNTKPMTVALAREFVIKTLEDKGLLISKKPISHQVKCAERSGFPLEILQTKQFYVRVLPFKNILLEMSKLLKFHPESMRIKLENWINGLSQDWCISRNRFFGIEIPGYYRRLNKNDIEKILECKIPEDLLIPGKSSTKNSVNGIVFKSKQSAEKLHTEILQKFNTNCEINEVEIQNPVKYSDGSVQQIASFKPDNNCEYFKNSRYLSIKPQDYNGVAFAVVLEKLDNVLLDKYIKLLDDEYIFCTLDKNSLPILSDEEILKKVTDSDIKFTDQVLDTWFTSGLSPHLSGKKDQPTSLRPQAHEIIRTWTFTTMVQAFCANCIEITNEKHKFDINQDDLSIKTGEIIVKCGDVNLKIKKPEIKDLPWENVMLSGWCLSSDKTKMSKSKGNIVTPIELIENFGSDSVRYWSAKASLGMDTPYSEENIKSGKRLITKIKNAVKMAWQDESCVSESVKIPENLINVTDKWILHIFSGIVIEYNKHMDEFQYSKGLDAIERFFWDDFCDTYLELVKVRSYGLNALIYEGVNLTNDAKIRIINDQNAAISTMRFILSKLLAMFGVFLPKTALELEKFTNKDISCTYNYEDGYKTGEGIKAVLNEVRKTKSNNAVSLKTSVSCIKIPKTMDLSVISNSLDLKNASCLSGDIIANDSDSIDIYLGV